MAILRLTPANAHLLENQKLYSEGQKWFAIDSPHLMYVVPKRISFSKQTRRKIFDRDEGRCRHCECELEFSDFHIDHLTPVSAGGGDEITNLAASCPPCNLSKGAH